MVKNPPTMLETLVDSWVRNVCWRRDRLPTPVLFLGFPCGSAGKESACDAGDLGLIPGLGRSPREGKGYPLQYSGLENPHGQRSLAGYNPWGHKESDTIERLRTIAMGMMRPQINRGHIVEINRLKSEDCSYGS